MEEFELYTVEEASKILNIPAETLRAGLQQQVFPFGVAIKLKNYVYYIFKLRLERYLNGEDIA